MPLDTSLSQSKSLLILLFLFFSLFISGRGTQAKELEIFPTLGPNGSCSVAYSSDGKYIVAGGMENTFKLWDASTGTELRTFRGHSSIVTCVAISPDSRFVVSGSGGGDCTIKLWDLLTGNVIKTFKPHLGVVSSVSFSQNSEYIVSGGANVTNIIIISTSSGKTIRTFKGHSRDVLSVAFSPDDKYIISGSWDKTLKLWNVSTGRLIRTFKGHSNIVYSVAFSPNGRLALSGSEDKTIRLWDISTGKTIKVFKGHTQRVKSVAFTPDGKHAASGSDDDNIKLWDISTGRLIRTIKCIAGVQSVAFSPDGKNIISGLWGNIIQLWETKTGRKIKTLKKRAQRFYSIDISPDGRYAISGSGAGDKDDSFLELWDISTGQNILNVKGISSWGFSVKFSPDGRYILSGSSDRTLKLWNVSTGRLIRTFKGHSKHVYSVAFSPNGSLALSGSDDNTIRLWDISTGKTIRVFEGHTKRVTSVAFTPDGKYALSGSWDKTLKLWNVSTGRLIRTFRGANKSISAVTISPNGKYALSGGWNQTNYLWDMSTGRIIKPLKGGSIICVVFTPDSKFAVSGGYQYLSLWDIEKGTMKKIFVGHTERVPTVALSPNGQYIFSVSDDCTTRIWNIFTGEEIARRVSFKDDEWIIITPEGFFNASLNGARYLNVRIGNNVYSIENFSRKFFRPEMVQLALAGKPLPQIDILLSVSKKIAPSVQIISPKDSTSTKNQETKLKVKISDIGSGIGDIYVYVNGSLASTNTRAIRIKSKKDYKLFQFNIQLIEGNNIIKVIAYNKANTMASNPKIISIRSDYKAKQKNLYILAVGIDTYENDDLNLRFAVKDAMLFADTVKNKSKSLFKNIKLTFLSKPEETTKRSIIEAFRVLSTEVKAGDYFLFYNASHGYIAEFNNGDSSFFLITSNVIFLDPNNLKKDTLSQDELIELIGNIPAQNKIIVLDTCHSGEAGRVIQIAMAGAQKTYTRAMSLATAMQLLKMAAGSSVFTASQSVEQALEGYSCHGLFTFTLAEGIQGKADENKDTFITLNELKGYVERNVFIRSKKHFKRKQVPYINIGTLDLPLFKTE